MKSETYAREILPLFPENLRAHLAKELNSTRGVEEIRLGVGKPIFLYCGGVERVVAEGPKQEPYLANREDIAKVLQTVSRYSLYAFEEELRHGYITVPGGHRVGLTGKAVLEGGRVKRICSISSLNIRIARQILGAANPLLPSLFEGKSRRLYHTLIISPPKKGKTTLLRDIARNLSYGSSLIKPLRVGIVDERSELSGCFQGVPQLDVGLRTDVLDACPKAEGMMMLIRAMGPDVIITDEIGREEDVFALREALNAGVVVISSAHARSFTELKGRPVFKKILAEKFFQRFVVLGSSRGTGTVEMILDENGNSLKQEGWMRCSSQK